MLTLFYGVFAVFRMVANDWQTVCAITVLRVRNKIWVIIADTIPAGK